jgi:(R,R)-butanediol dehydrogenase/meso-butanediol dehydrogenase/diacetyl reductase
MALEGGGYAELALTHERQCVRLPQSVTMADGALVEPVAVALHAVNVSGLTAGQRVLVVGAGPIGLAVVWWARRRGAREVAVCDLAAERRERALALAATGIEEGLGAAAPVSARYDIVFDCAGAKGVLAGAVDSIRPRGTVVLAGLCTSPDSFVPFAAVRKEARILTSVFFSAQEFEDALDATCGEPRLAAALVTSSVSLWDLPAKFERLRRGDCSECKVLIEPRAGAAGPRDI